MHVIHARNVNYAWTQCLDFFESPKNYDRRPSRNGDVLVAPGPVSTVYRCPLERVLFDPVRDANPVFHLHEALWMLAGREDATWLDQFVGTFSARFAEDGGRMHGAYGRRWRQWFEGARTGSRRVGFKTSSGEHRLSSPHPVYDNIDQLDVVVGLLKKDPYDRQAVIQMWDAEEDLGVPGLKDRPCNTQIYLRADREVVAGYDVATGDIKTRLLDMTVLCRSNDVVFGCYGANVVHMSILQEYLAARIGVGVGTYTQVSNNWHMYESSRVQADPTSALESLMTVAESAGGAYPGPHRPLADDPETFDAEVRAYVEDPIEFGTRMGSLATGTVKNRFLVDTALPMLYVNIYRKQGEHERALLLCEDIAAPDWRRATIEWLQRRMK